MKFRWETEFKDTRGIYVLETEEKISELGLEKSNAKLLPVNAIVITAKGTVGEVRLLGEAMAFNQTCYGLTPTSNMSCYYLFLALRNAITCNNTN